VSMPEVGKECSQCHFIPGVTGKI
jgi:hypothetical protein